MNVDHCACRNNLVYYSNHKYISALDLACHTCYRVPSELRRESKEVRSEVRLVLNKIFFDCLRRLIMDGLCVNLEEIERTRVSSRLGPTS